MKNNWKKVRLGDFAEINPRVSLKRNDEYFFIPMEDVQNNKARYVVASKTKRYAGGGAKFKNEDILFARITPCLQNGKISQVKNLKTDFGFGSTEFVVMRSRKDISNPAFIYYLAVSDSVKKKAEKSMSGATGRQRADYKNIENIEIRVPDLLIQKKIADVLSAYDDLIENNNRRIKILEEMAQLIYKEWFVNFKFPRLRQGSGGQAGREKVKMVEGELGLMPEDWEVKKIKDLINIKSGFAFSSAVYNNEDGYGLVTIKNVQDAEFITRCTTRISSVPKNMPEHCFLREGDIILSLTGNIGRVCLVYGDKYLLNQRVAKLVPIKDEYNGFIYFLFRESEFKNKLEMVSNGVAQQNLSPIEMGEIKIIFPANNYMEMFHENVRYIIETIIVLKNKNNILRQTRDLLLPKLMSGETNL